MDTGSQVASHRSSSSHELEVVCEWRNASSSSSDTDEEDSSFIVSRYPELLHGNVTKEAAVSFLSEMILTETSEFYGFSMDFVTALVNEDDPEPSNLGKLLYLMMLFIEEAGSPTDLGVSVNTYLGNLSEWQKWDWMALKLSIELGLNTITYEEIKSRIPDDFVETLGPCELYDVVNVLDKFNGGSDLPCSVDDLTFRCKELLGLADDDDWLEE